jgi:ubiquinone/menaquinone biosynthesis C-methylase UbiE
MSLLYKLKHRFAPNRLPITTDPQEAYNLWSEQYDAQPGNLMLDLDEEIFANILGKIPLKDKTVIDIGCGTGRHWNKILSQKPFDLSGYDVSVGMLKKLTEKYPEAAAFQLLNNNLPGVENENCDVIISTLTIAHIENIVGAISEWERILKPGGHIIITDYHPEALIKGADRTFTVNGQTIAIKNYVHTINCIFNIIANLGFELVHLQERKIDDTVKHYYEKKRALPVFYKFEGVPIIYGMLLRKKDATA